MPDSYLKIFNEFGSSIIEKIIVKKQFTFSGTPDTYWILDNILKYGCLLPVYRIYIMFCK